MNERPDDLIEMANEPASEPVLDDESDLELPEELEEPEELEA